MEDSFGMADSPLVRAHTLANMADECYRNRRYQDAAINHGRAAVLLEEAMQQFTDTAIGDCLRQQRTHHLDQERLYGLLVVRMKHFILHDSSEAVAAKEDREQAHCSDVSAVAVGKRPTAVAAAAPAAVPAVNAGGKRRDDPPLDYSLDFDGGPITIPNCPAAMVKLYEFQCAENDAMVNQLKLLRATIQDLALRLQMQEAGRLDVVSEIS